MLLKQEIQKLSKLPIYNIIQCQSCQNSANVVKLITCIKNRSRGFFVATVQNFVMNFLNYFPINQSNLFLGSHYQIYFFLTCRTHIFQ